MIKTRITEMLGIKYPIVQGGMQWLSNAELASAVSNAGGLGFITAASYPTEKELREEIRKTKQLTDAPFGVNISMLPQATYGDLTDRNFDVVIEEGVTVVETSGRNPEKYVPLLKDAGIKMIHKVPAVRFAKKAEQIGADAVTIVGFECGGHPGLDDVTTMVLTPKAASTVSIPVLAGGGIADARGFVAALALGAEGVVMGTRFAAAKECVGHPNFKGWLLNAEETDTVIIERSIRNPLRAIRNAAAEKVIEMERQGATLEELMTIISGKIGRLSLLEGKMDAGVVTSGQVVGLIKEIKPVKEIIDEMVEESTSIILKLTEAFKAI